MLSCQRCPCTPYPPVLCSTILFKTKCTTFTLFLHRCCKMKIYIISSHLPYRLQCRGKYFQIFRLKVAKLWLDFFSTVISPGVYPKTHNFLFIHSLSHPPSHSPATASVLANLCLDYDNTQILASAASDQVEGLKKGQ